MDRTLFYSNMTVSLCIRQESKRNDDSVSVEELDWSAFEGVLYFWQYSVYKLLKSVAGSIGITFKVVH